MAGAIPRRVGLVGFGSLGKYLAEQISAHPETGLQLAFVWNRTPDTVRQSPYADLLLEDLKDCASRQPDIIVEVAHPQVVQQYGEIFLQVADFFVGSPSAFADGSLNAALRRAAIDHSRTLYIPSGALWGANDIIKLATAGKLQALSITMRKHPTMLKVLGPLKEKIDLVTDAETVLYSGDVRTLCPLAPSNVNTMAAGAIAAHNLGFDKVQGKLIADPCAQAHTVTVEVTGPASSPGGPPMTITTVRVNPALPGQVTGLGTYISFFSSLQAAHSRPPGVQFV